MGWSETPGLGKEKKGSEKKKNETVLNRAHQTKHRHMRRGGIDAANEETKHSFLKGIDIWKGVVHRWGALNVHSP